MARKRASIEVYLPQRLKRGARVDLRDVEFFHDKSVLLSESIMYFGSYPDNNSDESGIDFRLFEEFLKNLMILQSIGRPITILMNNPGGDVNHGLAMYDAIKMCTVPTSIVIHGSAMSMAAIVMQAADYRYMMPNARLMVHSGQTGYFGETENFKRFAKEIKELDAITNQILVDRTGLSLQVIEKLVTHDTYLTAHKAVELGFADKVLAYPKKDTQRGTNRVKSPKKAKSSKVSRQS